MGRNYKHGKCSVCGRESKLHKGDLCSKHYNQMKKYGKFLDDNPRCQYDLNEIIVYENHAEIILYDNLGYEINRTLIDLEDVEKVKNYKWVINTQGYVVTTMNKKGVRLHRYIMGCEKPEKIDHINRNKLDNRKCNLRICNTKENNRNLSRSRNNKSCVTGVCWSKGRWRAYITFNNKNIDLGYFDKFCDAVECRWKCEKELFKEYSPLNSYN